MQKEQYQTVSSQYAQDAQQMEERLYKLPGPDGVAGGEDDDEEQAQVEQAIAHEEGGAE